MNIIEGVTRCGCMRPNGLQCSNAAFVMVKTPTMEEPNPTCRLDLNWLVGSLKPEEIKQIEFKILDDENQSDLDNILQMHIDPIEWGAEHKTTKTIN